MSVAGARPIERFYRHGWHSFSPVRWVDPASPVPIVPVVELRLGGDDPVYGLSERHGGSAVGAAECAGGEVVLLGALDLGARVECIGGSLEGRLERRSGRWLVAWGSEEEVFTRYAQLLGERFGVRKRAPAPRTWSSWYSLYADISEQRLLAVLAGLDGLPFDCFEVDDGWQRAIGDWRANARFPSGMQALASSISRAGLLPGLWLAPFIAAPGAPVLREHPDWFVHGDDDAPVRAGHNWGGSYFALDLTHPDALAHVAEVVRRAVGWGYRYLKLDFLFAGAVPGRRYEERIGREEAYRRGVEALRAAAGDDVYLLGCGAPIVASLGVFDGLRVGPDVAPYWDNALATRYLRAIAEPGARNAIVTSVHRLWLRPIVDVDPDVVYFRERGQLLSAAQRAALQDLARVCGFRATSDPPDWLDPGERTALARFLDEEPAIRRRGRYEFEIDGRPVDFGSIVREDPDFAPDVAITRARRPVIRRPPGSPR